MVLSMSEQSVYMRSKLDFCLGISQRKRVEIDLYDVSIAPKHSLPKTGSKYTPGYAFSMHDVCKMCASGVHLQTECTLFQLTLLIVQDVCTNCMHKVCICIRGAHYFRLH